ncbi:MAG: undecaprenyl-diphosphatase [Acidimicrobiaceae bacterium]|nr:undecaprenyl-diphosphatase [Acidimicrobiaceae bacterium]
MLSYFQSIVIGLIQGVTELFPISSLGHSVLLPAVMSKVFHLHSWDPLVKSQTASESFYLAFLVGLHVATAIALLIFFRQDWVRIIRGFFSSFRKRRIETSDERMAWLLVCTTVPVGVIGLLFEHSLRTVFAKPTAAAVFLAINGVLLLAGERVRKRTEVRELARASAQEGSGGSGPEEGRELETLALSEGGIIGSSQILALFAGISRSGVSMVGGLLRGLNHEDAARFSFLMATPIILAAGVYKLPDLTGPNGDGIRGQVLVGALFAGVAAYASVRFLVKYFETKTLTPFGIYCLVVGIALTVRFGFF